jgi:tetratricopeptide (TPR) repeat protein
MPGVGKTTLAVHAARMVAEKYPDGTFYLNFHTHDPRSPALDSAEALHRLLRMLGLPATQIPDAIAERAALWRAQLSRRRALVILDDAARHDQIRPLLPAGGRSQVVVTARRRLDLEGARVLTLDVLPVPEAIALFARTAGPGRVGDTEQIAIVELCGRLPLAIQLTAGRLARGRDLEVAGLVDELTRSPARLAGGVASPEVMNAFDLSYRALEPDHQRFFRRLGLNPCADVSLQGAAALAGSTLAEAEKALVALLDHHLLVRAPAGMFRFHDLIRGYAATRASQEDPSPERRQAVGRVLDYYLRTADEADQGWLELEWRNILEAAQHAGRHEWKRHCADLVHSLASFVDVKGYWDEALQAQKLALQACRDLADEARIARAALDLSVVNQQVGRHEATLALAEEAAAIYQSLADQRGLARALDQVGLVHQRSARSREALAYFTEAGTLYSDSADAHGKATALSHAGIACWHQGRYQDAVSRLNEALALYREVGDRLGEGKTLNNLGKMQLHSGYHRDALETFHNSLEIFTEIGGAQTQAVLHHNIGSVYHYKGSYDEGLAAYRRALAIYCSIGDLPDEADVLNDIGAIYQSAECYDEALIHYEKAMLIAEEIGSQAHQVIALRGIADVRRGFGRFDEAFEGYNTALRLARDIGDPYEEAKVLEGIAETTLSTQKPYAARILFRQALDIFSRLGVPEAESARIRMETTDPALGRRISLPA